MAGLCSNRPIRTPLSLRTANADTSVQLIRRSERRAAPRGPVHERQPSGTAEPMKIRASSLRGMTLECRDVRASQHSANQAVAGANAAPIAGSPLMTAFAVSDEPPATGP